jgi:hypothetical protein
MKRFVIAPDVHGIEQDPYAVESFHRFVADFKPEVRIIAGDLWDFAAIRNGATPEEKAQSMASDFEAGCNFANRLFKGGKENHLLLGNHDVRLWDMQHSLDATRRDLAERMVADVMRNIKGWKCQMLPYDSRHGVLKLGHLTVVHGYHTGANACAAHARIYGNVVFGHIHSIEAFQTPGLDQKEARSIGCLCRLDMEYAARKTGKLKWAQGWAYGWLHHDGTYTIHQARKIGDKFYASKEINFY